MSFVSTTKDFLKSNSIFRRLVISRHFFPDFIQIVLSSMSRAYESSIRKRYKFMEIVGQCPMQHLIMLRLNSHLCFGIR